MTMTYEQKVKAYNALLARCSEPVKAKILELQDRYLGHPDYDRKANPAHVHPTSFYMQQVAAKALAEGRIIA